MRASLTKNLEQSLLRTSLASRYVLIAYINAREIDYDIIFEYIGRKGNKILYGQQYLSIYTIDEKKLKQLIRSKFVFKGREKQRPVTTAVMCFEQSKISTYVVKLRDECVDAVKTSSLFRDVVRLIDTLNDLHGRGKTSIPLSEFTPPFLESGYDHYKLLFLLMVLMPEVFRLKFDGVDLHEYIINNFDSLMNKVKNMRSRDPTIFKLFDATLNELNIMPNQLSLLIMSAPIKYKVPLEILYVAVEHAYWKFLASVYKEQGKLIRMVNLQSLLPFIEEELKKRGYLLPSLSEIFNSLKRIESMEISEHGRCWIHIALPEYRGDTFPIPIIFHAPRNVSPKELEELGLSVSTIVQS